MTKEIKYNPKTFTVEQAQDLENKGMYVDVKENKIKKEKEEGK